MENKKRDRIRKKYEALKNSDLEQKIKDLEVKKQNKTITKEEYKEYNKLIKIQKNLPKAKNIFYYISILEKEIKEIDKEIRKIESAEVSRKKEDENQKLEENLDMLLKEKEKIQIQIHKQTDAKEKDKLKAELDKINSDIDDNNKKFAQNKEFINKNRNDKEANKNIEELKEIKEEMSTKISKCNMIANNLLNGYSWDSIELNLDSWKERKLTANKENKQKMKEKMKAVKSSNKPTPTRVKEQSKIKKYLHDFFLGDYGDNEYKPKENLPVATKSFDEKHPTIAKLKNWIKDKYKNLKDFILGENDGVKNKGKKSEEEKANIAKDEEFKKYIKEIAEKGYKKVENEKKQDTKEKFKEMKEEAHKRDEEKFGDGYGR